MRRRSSLGLLVLCLALVLGLGAPLTAAAAPEAHGRHHIVRYGETLSGIAAHYGFTYRYLATYNGLSNPHRIYVGQLLHIPAGGAPAPSGFYYVVRPGDTLSGIAFRYGTTVSRLMADNGLRSTVIYVGQRLFIRSGGGADIPHPPHGSITYCIRYGDTLWGIARRYGTTVGAIMALNGMHSTRIYAGTCILVGW